MEPLDFEIISNDFQRWINNIPPRIQNWFQSLPQRAQQWPNELVEWAKARPERIQYFFQNFQPIMQAKWDRIARYFQTCDEWEYIFWGADGACLIMVIVALVFW